MKIVHSTTLSIKTYGMHRYNDQLNIDGYCYLIVSDEKDLVGLYCMDYYFNEQDDSMPPYAFRRQQSRLYQKLHPDPVSLHNKFSQTSQ